ncbi:hypothetical protein P7C70_g2829, partial [Phenoliferia sp. Uapishka_3]
MKDRLSLLPREILHRVFSNFVSPAYKIRNPPADHKTLLALCQVSHLFCDVAQPLLFSRVYLRKEKNAQLFLSSGALGRCRRIEELGTTGGYTEQMSQETISALIAIAGGKSVKSLRIGNHAFFDASALELAGPKLQSLTNTCGDTFSKESDGWNFPFQLTHFDFVYDNDSDWADKVSALIKSSPFITSLGMRIREPLSTDPPSFSFPEFSSIASHITTLLLGGNAIVTSLRDALIHFSSITHLFLDYDTPSIQLIVIILDSFSTRKPTIKRLTLNLRKEAFTTAAGRNCWNRIANHRALGALEEIIWTDMDTEAWKVFGNVSRGDREVKMVRDDRFSTLRRFGFSA